MGLRVDVRERVHDCAGAAGGIGQPLALLMKMNPLVGELSLYDVVGTPGVGADLSHIDTAPKVVLCAEPTWLVSCRQPNRTPG